MRVDTLELDSLTVDPVSPPDGLKWFNVTEGKHKRRIGGVTKISAHTDDLPATHSLGGSEHSVDTLANLNSKVSDASLGPPVKTYTWFQDSTKPFIEFKGTVYTVQDRIRFAGTSKRTPTEIHIVVQVDAATTADIRIFDSDNTQVIAEKTGMVSTSWILVDLGALSNLSSAPVIWEIQLKTSAANKNVRVSSMDIEF